MNKLQTLILDGKKVAEKILSDVSNEINLLKSRNKRIPGLAVILIGNNLASHTYVKNKEKACKKIGLYSEIHCFNSEVSQKEVINLINSLNKNEKIDGILVQFPLPPHISLESIFENLEPKKDVDGLHPYNLGKLAAGQKLLVPCTPKAIIEILNYYSINITGLHTIVIGRSNLVGKPLSLLLLENNATVTVVHSKSKNIENITRTGDILICAIGKPNLVTQNWVKPGAIIIDVGINKILINNEAKIVGDVDFKSVSSVCQAITPVPGGVGPVTVAMLLANTLEAYKLRGKA